jgi:cation:H+ antiporter
VGHQPGQVQPGRAAEQGERRRGRAQLRLAILLAVHGRGADAIGTLISSKVNQWTLLVGSLPVAYLAGGGGTALPLDGRQVEEFLLTAAQTLLGVAALLSLRFPRWLGFTLLGLFGVQYAVPGQAGRHLLCAL